MNPPYQITPLILSYLGRISQTLGKLEGLSISAPEPKLRKKNQIRTIKSTLAIEGNTFSEDQMTLILENKKVIGSSKEIAEVKNAINLYSKIQVFKVDSLKSFLESHQVLMKDLVLSSGKLRSKNVGVLKGKVVKHVAPSPKMVPELMVKLFNWIKKEKELHPLVKSCIIHYEIEFIHPFEDGNGRMGRFWQSLMLFKFNPIFSFIPVESLIEKNQIAYYEALELSDKKGSSTPFIEFILSVILLAIEEFDAEMIAVVITSKDRLESAHKYFNHTLFSRREYMELFKTLSTSTASRDLKEGVDSRLLKKVGDKNQAKYKFVKSKAL